jgi:hypothetical protein
MYGNIDIQLLRLNGKKRENCNSQKSCDDFARKKYSHPLILFFL